MVQQTLEFASDLAELASMRGFILEACRRAWGSQDAETVDQVLLAMQEAATNIVRHGYQDAARRPIRLALRVDGHQVCLDFSYHGIAFDPASVPPPAFDGSRLGGFGVYLIRKLVDEVIYSSDSTGRCTVRLVKRRPAPPFRKD
jgi:serine/threonine-protein kinase RsbW